MKKVDIFEIEDIGFPLLMKQVVESNFTGILFVNRNNWRKGLIFNSGNLCVIQSNKPEELLGNLLVEKGLIGEDENEASLRKAKIEMKKQGVALLEMGFVQPHEIRHSLKHQLETRLLDIFAWYAATIKKIEKPGINKSPELSREEFAGLIRKGVMEYTPFSQITNALSAYADARPKPGPNSLPRDMDIDMQKIFHYRVSELLNFGQDVPRALLGHYCTGLITFDEGRNKGLLDKLSSRLKEIKDQDPFKVIGVDQNISDSGLQRAYMKIIKANHPDNYSYANDPEVNRLANKIFTGIKKAYSEIKSAR